MCHCLLGMGALVSPPSLPPPPMPGSLCTRHHRHALCEQVPSVSLVIVHSEQVLSLPPSWWAHSSILSYARDSAVLDASLLPLYLSLSQAAAGGLQIVYGRSAQTNFFTFTLQRLSATALVLLISPSGQGHPQSHEYQQLTLHLSRS